MESIGVMKKKSRGRGIDEINWIIILRFLIKICKTITTKKRYDNLYFDILEFSVEMAGDIYYQLLSENKQYRITIDSQYILVSELKRRISIELGKNYYLSKNKWFVLYILHME